MVPKIGARFNLSDWGGIFLALTALVHEVGSLIQLALRIVWACNLSLCYRSNKCLSERHGNIMIKICHFLSLFRTILWAIMDTLISWSWICALGCKLWNTIYGYAYSFKWNPCLPWYSFSITFTSGNTGKVKYVSSGKRRERHQIEIPTSKSHNKCWILHILYPASLWCMFFNGILRNIKN